jgi:hypothetical protein
MWKVGVDFLLICFVAMQPSNTLSEAAFAVGEWGNGAWASGSAYNYRTQSEAAAAAMNACNQRAYNCSIRTTFRKACFALASQDGGSAWQTGIHINPDAANRYALVTCAKWGLQCTIREEFCDNVSEAEVRAAEEAEYRQYVQQWYACFGRAGTLDEQINNCDYALNFPRASQDDRNNLVRQRSAVIAARSQELANAQAALDAQKAANARAQEEFHMYELRWQHCFDLSAPVTRIDDQITSCDYALTYPRASADDRSKLIEHRSALIISRDELAQDRTRRTQTTQQSSTEHMLVQDEPLAVDPRSNEKLEFSWLGFSAIALTLQFFSIWVFLSIWGWSALAEGRNADAFTQNEMGRIVLSSFVLLGAGMLLGFLQNQVLIEHAGFLAGAGFMLEAFGNSLVAIATGAWVSSRFFDPKSRVPLRSLIPIWLVVAATSIATLSSRAVYGSEVDPWIIVGLVSAWTFVLGYLLCDPIVNPFLQRLDKRIGQLLAPVVSIIEGLRSPTKSERDNPRPLQLRSVIQQNDEQDGEKDDAISWDVPTVSFPSAMQLKLKRSQRKGLMGKMVFALDARMVIPRAERDLIERYRLGHHVIYESAARQRHTETFKARLESTKQFPGMRESVQKQFLGIGKNLFRLGLAGVSAARVSMSLRITVYSLINGEHIECKLMSELLGAEQAIIEAAENLRAYLNAAATFDGREQVLEF